MWIHTQWSHLKSFSAVLLIDSFSMSTGWSSSALISSCQILLLARSDFLAESVPGFDNEIHIIAV